MPRFGKFSALVCKNCQRLIPLPAATHPAPEQPSWPADCADRSFLCPTCKHVYVYSIRDVRQMPFDESTPPNHLKRQDVVRIGLECGAGGGCPGLVQLRTLMAFDADLPREVPGLLAESNAHEIPCDRGHTLSGPCRPSGVNFAAQFDDAWELGNV